MLSLCPASYLSYTISLKASNKLLRWMLILSPLYGRGNKADPSWSEVTWAADRESGQSPIFLPDVRILISSTTEEASFLASVLIFSSLHQLWLFPFHSCSTFTLECKLPEVRNHFQWCFESDTNNTNADWPTRGSKHYESLINATYLSLLKPLMFHTPDNPIPFL